MLGSARRYFAQALKKRLPSRWPLLRLFRSSAPHSGQSSQLPLDANDGNTQFLATPAGSTLILPLTPRREHLQRVAVRAHSGQSSQLAFDVFSQ